MSKIEEIIIQVDSNVTVDHWQTIARAKHLRKLGLHLYVPVPKMSTTMMLLANVESLELRLLDKNLHDEHEIIAQLHRSLAFAPNTQHLRVVISSTNFNGFGLPLRDLLVSLAHSGINIHLYGFPLGRDLQKLCQHSWGCIEMEGQPASVHP